MVDYRKFWDLIDERGIPQSKLIEAGISRSILDSLRHNKNMTTDTLVRVCDLLGCQFGDIMENVPADQVKDKGPAKNKGGRPRKKS